MCFGLWKSRWCSINIAGGTLCYSPGRVCRSIVKTVILHNISIDSGLQEELHNNTEADDIVAPFDTTLSGTIERQSVVTDYFD